MALLYLHPTWFFSHFGKSRALFGLLLLLVQFNEIFSVSTTGDPVWNIRHVLPSLDLANNSVTDMEFNVGDNAFLPCRFPRYSRHHENGVSWIRRWDWQILSAGVYMHINDDRFSVLHKDGTEDWTLQIKYVKLSDKGTYECQVHTGNQFLSHFVNLAVVKPKAIVLGPEELHVRTGDVFSITCVIDKVISTPIYLMWNHRGNPVNYAPDRPRLTISVNVQGVHTTSTLAVVDTEYGDSGNYSCSAPNAEAASVLVFVTEGDTVAAVQRRDSTSSGISLSFSSNFFVYISLWLLQNKVARDS